MTESWAQWGVMLVLTLAANAVVIWGTYRAFQARTETRLEQGDKKMDTLSSNCVKHSETLSDLQMAGIRRETILVDHEKRITKLEDHEPVGVR